MLVSDVVTQVRDIIQDTQTPYRYSDDMLVRFLNQTLKRMVVLRPDLFSSIEEIPTESGTPFQSLPSDAMRLVDIYQVKGSTSVTEINRETIERSAPRWAAEEPGTPVNFMRNIRNDTRFFLYPAPKDDVVLIGEYAKTPENYALDDEIDVIPDGYFPVLIDGVVFVAESVDDEYVNNQRAQMYQQMFTQGLGTSSEARIITDFDNGGIGDSEVK